MDSVLLARSSQALDGLRDMMEAACEGGDYVQSFVEIEIALLIIKIAKQVPDRDEWFIHGKWAMIQALQGRVTLEISKLQLESLR
jgi:hypothetical protein